MGRCFNPIAQVSIIGMLSLLAVIELRRSMRSFTVNNLATADCLFKQGRLSRREANQAVPRQLREVGISQHVMSIRKC